MIERLPTPWGLVRLGVAPDHPQLKTVSRAFEKIAARPGFRFLGNVEVGRDVDARRARLALRRRASTRSARRPTGGSGIPGEDLPGSWAATELVAWYNGHPDFQQLAFDLSHERAVVIGNGNVALDVARMLALTARGARADRHDGRGDRRDRRRRGSARSSSSDGAAPCRPRGRRPSSASSASSPARTSSSTRRSSSSIRRARRSSRPPRTSCSATSRSCASSPRASRRGKPRVVRLRFRVSPVAILGDERVEAVEIVRNRLEPDGSGSVRAVATDEREVIPCGIVFRSVGYRGVGAPGRAVRRAHRHDPERRRPRARTRTGRRSPGLYCAGWIKRGPTGVIGTNKKDATETVELLLEDARAGRLPARSGESDRRAARRARRRRRHVRGLGGDRRARDARAASRRAARASSSATWDELLEAPRALSLRARRASARRRRRCCRRATRCAASRRAPRRGSRLARASPRRPRRRRTRSRSCSARARGRHGSGSRARRRARGSRRRRSRSIVASAGAVATHMNQAGEVSSRRALVGEAERRRRRTSRADPRPRTSRRRAERPRRVAPGGSP